MHRSAAFAFGRVAIADSEQPFAHELGFVLVDFAAERDGLERCGHEILIGLSRLDVNVE